MVFTDAGAVLMVGSDGYVAREEKLHLTYMIGIVLAAKFSLAAAVAE